MIYALINKLKYTAIKHPMVSMSSFGDITLYEDKLTIAYPYVNFDVINSTIKNYVKTYNIRVYVCDRNNPYIAYNKTEVILDDILKSLEIDEYRVNYFTLNFKDVVNGLYVDFSIDVALEGSCTYDSLFNSSLLLEEGTFILQENGDLIITTNP